MLMTKNVGMECLLGSTGTCTKGATLMTKDTGTEKCIGRENVVIKEIGRMEFKFNKVNVISCR